MKKSVLRLTESELKNYIRKIVSEQTAPAPQAVDLTKVLAGVKDKTVQLFLDAGNTQKSTVVKINNVVRGNNSIVLEVTDLAFVTDYGQSKNLSGGQKRTTSLEFNCDKRQLITRNLVDAQNAKTFGAVYNNGFQKMLTELMGCSAPIKTGGIETIKTDF
jgi:hypothetical protein